MPDIDRWGDITALRLAAEALTDAKGMRVRASNRAGADLRIHGNGLFSDQKGPYAMIGPALVEVAERHESVLAAKLVELYEEIVPFKVRGWAVGVPLLNPRVRLVRPRDGEPRDRAEGVLFARIVGLTGNPRRATPYRLDEKRRLIPAGEPYDRSLRQFWQWCGCGDPENIPRKDMTQAELLSMGKRKQVRPLLRAFSDLLVQLAGRSPQARNSDLYGVYLKARDEAAGRVHERQCRNRNRPPMKPNGCGTREHPEWGEPGSPWRPGHINAHAHRIVQKELLRQFWQVAEGTI